MSKFLKFSEDLDTYVIKVVWLQIETHTRHVIIILDRSYIRIVFAEEMPLQFHYGRFALDATGVFRYHIGAHNVENK